MTIKGVEIAEHIWKNFLKYAIENGIFLEQKDVKIAEHIGKKFSEYAIENGIFLEQREDWEFFFRTWLDGYYCCLSIVEEEIND